MKIIRITTDNEIEAIEYPTGSIHDQNEKFKELIGPKCNIYEHIMPNRLYNELGGSPHPSHREGSGVSVLIDESGLYHDLDMNMVGCYLYETDKHGHPIVGNILVIGEYIDNMDGELTFSGISDDQFEKLYPQLETLAGKAKGFKQED